MVYYTSKNAPPVPLGGRKVDSMKKIAAALAAIVLGLALAGCQADPVQTTPANTTDPVPEATTLADMAQETTPGTTPESTYPPAPIHSIAVDTEYGQLFFQDQWLEFMHIEQRMEADALTVTFYGTVEGQRYPLFCFTIGGDGGEPLGTLTDLSGKQRPVYAKMLDLGDTSQLSQSHQNRLYAMKEDINFVLENLR